MLIAKVNASKETVGITAGGCSKTKIAVMVASTIHAWLVGYTKAVGAVVLPKTIRADMTARLALIPFDIAIGKVFPRIVVLRLMLVSHGEVETTLVKAADTD